MESPAFLFAGVAFKGKAGLFSPKAGIRKFFRRLHGNRNGKIFARPEAKYAAFKWRFRSKAAKRATSSMHRTAERASSIKTNSETKRTNQMSTQHRNTEARSRSRVIPHAELEPLTYKIAAECLCLNLRKASRLITQYYDQILEPAGIRCTQLTILAAISRIGNRSLTDLAQSLAMDRTTLTRNLKPLEKHGWVIRVDSPNHRMRNYALSDSGEQVLKEAVPLWQEAQNSIVGMLGDSRRKRLFQHLLRVTAAGRRAIKKEDQDSEREE